jgi:hypothetical protein
MDVARELGARAAHGPITVSGVSERVRNKLKIKTFTRKPAVPNSAGHHSSGILQPSRRAATFPLVSKAISTGGPVIDVVIVAEIPNSDTTLG